MSRGRSRPPPIGLTKVLLFFAFLPWNKRVSHQRSGCPGNTPENYHFGEPRRCLVCDQVWRKVRWLGKCDGVKV